MTDAAILPVSKHLCFSIYSASHAFTRAYRNLLAPLNLTYPQYLVLLVLWEQDGMRVKEIGSKLFLDSGTLTPLLKRLETIGYVRRVRDPSDERQVAIMLTPEGQELEAKAGAVPHDLQCMTHISVEEHDELAERIAKLRSSLQNATGEVLAPA